MVLNRINETLRTGPIIGVAPFRRGWAYLFWCHLPMIHKLRLDNPDATIVTGGYASDWIFFKDICDYYAPITWSASEPRTRAVGGELTSDELEAIIPEELGRCDEYHHINPDALLANVYGDFTTNLPKYPFNNNPKSNKIAIWGRNKPSRGSDNHRNGSNELWDRTIQHLLAAGHEVVVCGEKKGSYVNTSVEHVTHLEPQIRMQKTIDILSNCLCSLSDDCSSVDFNLYIGMPTLVCNPCSRDVGLFKTHNIYHTHLEFAELQTWGLMQKQPANSQLDELYGPWMEHVFSFIDKARTQPSYKLTINHTAQIFEPYRGQNG